MALIINDPASDWGKAGLHSSDRLLSLNGTAVRTWPDFRRIISTWRVGDTATFVVQTPGAAPRTVKVPVTQYRRHVARIVALPNVSDRQRRLREAWMRAR